MKVLVPVIADVIIVEMLTIAATQAEEKMEWMKLLSTTRELVSPYKRKKGKEFMEDHKASISSGTWRNLETFCLIVCREVLLSHSISENPGNLKLLYNFVAQSDSVKAMLLPISVKSTSQIAAKIAYLIVPLYGIQLILTQLISPIVLFLIAAKVTINSDIIIWHIR
ncbi:unnamed protein product [Porites evermanni]|uniref:Uncharacterized protein n=1 Tax=Porites evermanni TaxID=104178 RepID=A0ABN8M8U1_9CNID|nr:unnamed protein product [Porites evermanni]